MSYILINVDLRYSTLVPSICRIDDGFIIEG